MSNVRARRIIVRKKNGYLQLTHPPSVSLTFIKKSVEEMRPKIISLIEKKSNNIHFSPLTEFSTYSFAVKIIESTTTSNYYVRLKDGVLYISCPVNTNFDDTSVQVMITRYVENALRHEAKRLLPGKVYLFAEQFGFKVSGVKINKSRTRWGSCSSKKNINLSYYCLLLPEHLIDHVILHELCHTVEMNHGEHFWKLLDRVSDGKATTYTNELKSFKVLI